MSIDSLLGIEERRWLVFGSDDRKVWAFVASYLFSGTAFGIFSLLLPAYALSLNATTEKIGMIQGALSLGLVATILPAGFLTDRFGSRRLYILSGFLMAAIILTMPLAKELAPLILAVAVAGCIGSFNMTSTNAAFFNNLRRMGESKTGWYRGALTIGLSLIGPIAGGWIIEGFGFTRTFIVVAALWMVPALSAVILTSSAPVAGSGRVDVPVVHQVKNLLVNHPLLGALALEGIGVATVGVYATFIVVLSLERLGLTVQYVGWLLGLEGIGYAAVLFFGGKLLTMLSRKKLVLVSFTGTALSFAIFATASGFSNIALGSAILGLALGLLGLMNMSTLANTRVGKGSVAGFHGFSIGVFAGLGPLVAGFIGKTKGLEAIFWSVAVLYVGLAVLRLTVLSRAKVLTGEKSA